MRIQSLLVVLFIILTINCLKSEQKKLNKNQILLPDSIYTNEDRNAILIKQRASIKVDTLYNDTSLSLTIWETSPDKNWVIVTSNLINSEEASGMSEGFHLFSTELKREIKISELGLQDNWAIIGFCENADRPCLELSKGMEKMSVFLDSKSLQLSQKIQK